MCSDSALNIFFLWCPCMTINVRRQYKGGFLLDIILLTLCYRHWGALLRLKNFCFYNQCSNLNVLTFAPPVIGWVLRINKV